MAGRPKVFHFKRRTASYDLYEIEANTAKEALRKIREGWGPSDHEDGFDKDAIVEFIRTTDIEE